MNINNFLIQTKSRIIFGDKWLYREKDGMYIVMNGRRNEKHAECLIQSHNEEEAVNCLLYHGIE
jgi:hypothetical protein